ncbi:MAG: DUF4340 domain-containing protein [Caldilineaceae bacterium]
MKQKHWTRANYILAGVLLLQIGLAAWLFVDNYKPMLGLAAPRAPAQPLVANLQLGDVTGVRVSDASGSVQLAKGADGWTAPAADGYPAAAASVTKLISDVLAIDTGRLVADTTTSHGRLRVDPNNYGRRIELDRANGEPVVVYLGSSPNANATHVRLDGQDQVYLASGALASEARSDLAGWIDTRYVTASPDDVARVEIFNSNGRFALAKATDGTWRLEDQPNGPAGGESVDQVKADELVSQLAGLQMLSPLGKQGKVEYGLETPRATATLTLSGTQDATATITLDVGALDDATGAYTVKSSDSEYYASVGKYAVQDLVDQTRAGLLAESAPEGTPGTKP